MSTYGVDDEVDFPQEMSFEGVSHRQAPGLYILGHIPTKYFPVHFLDTSA